LHLICGSMNMPPSPAMPLAPSEPDLPLYLRGLNEPQRHAVLTTEGGVLVLAGAGTGKTKALTSRIAHLITNRLAYPSQILAVTFTNKAAKEMTQRVQSLLHNEGATESVAGMWLGTFHAIAARILRRDGAAIGLSDNFAILDADDQLRLLKTLMNEMRVDEKRFPPKIMLAIIQSWKDRGLAPAKVSTDMLTSDYGKQAHAIYAPYQRRLMQLNATDFGDLLLHNLTLFQEHPDILQRYAEKFRYLLVDEYQDTNVAQYLWLRLLALGHGNICCVGDDDQSIYGWRGAEVGNILRFEQDFKGATVIRLEQNYRSTEHILGAASGLIANNESRHGKTLWTEARGGEKVKIISLWDDGEEARYVGEEIESLQRNKVALNDMAILVRAGFQTRAFEERFLTLGIPYRVIGGLRFYERREIRDAIAYLRLVVEPRDDLAFERIINTPKRGIGKSTLEELHSRARAHNISLFEATERLLAAGGLRGKAGGAMARLLEQRAAWQQMSADAPPAALCEQMLEQAGYMEMWRLEGNVEANGRLENLKELFRALQDFASLRDFLEHVSLVMELEMRDASESMVSIMSLHASKGLEFDVVFCTGWEEGLFPHQRALDENGATGLEEERRLAYVGITRAKRHLSITHASNRRIYNQWQSCIPSRFLQEIPASHTDTPEGAGRSSRTSPTLFQHRMDQVMQESTRVSVAASVWLGKRVFHAKFGYGRVVEESGNHLDIAFEKAGRKKLMADYVSEA
jgi:DNA helicase II / ATP-dependent DNA helicase PcrA